MPLSSPHDHENMRRAQPWTRHGGAICCTAHFELVFACVLLHWHLASHILSSTTWDTTSDMEARKRRKKLLLMGKSGAGKSSMRSIIFSNYGAKDVRRLGATIDIEHSHARFMGTSLNLWDCGGQDAFMDSYLHSQRENVFTGVQVLIYVFDIESRDVDRDLETYSAVIAALKEFSSDALIFALVHKMDLVQNEHRDRIYDERCRMISSKSEGMKLTTYPSSIWDQTLYKAWAGIVHEMIPNLNVIEKFLETFALQIQAEEIILFERSTFLRVSSVDTTVHNKRHPDESRNPNSDRFERISNIMKSYKHIVQKATSGANSSSTTNGFVLLKLQSSAFNLIISRFTEETYIAVVLPPGEAAFNVALINTMLTREAFASRTGIE